MTFQKIKQGKIGEVAAAAFLQRQGYQILERNFRNALGEIDIIALDGDTICFVEVKTRRSDAFGSPLESVTPAKRKKLVRVAQSYLKLNKNSEAKARFDVIAVFCEGARCRQVEVVKNAFEENG
jgi:putative endonuclease